MNKLKLRSQSAFMSKGGNFWCGEYIWVLLCTFYSSEQLLELIKYGVQMFVLDKYLQVIWGTNEILSEIFW